MKLVSRGISSRLFERSKREIKEAKSENHLHYAQEWKDVLGSLPIQQEFYRQHFQFPFYQCK
jgi:hypothetical protein